MAALRDVKADTKDTHNVRNHGGAREGAGRKPKALRYASELAAAEERMMSALPAAIECLESAAKGGDVAAAKYLLDRAFGRVKEQAAPVAEDKAIPYSETDAETDAAAHFWERSMREGFIPDKCF